MKIKEFDEKVRIGSQISFNGMVYAVVDIDRRTHEAIVGKAAIRIRCSEFELYTGGKVSPRKYNDPPVKLGRPSKPILAILPSGERVRFETMNEAIIKLNLTRYRIEKVLYGKQKSVNGICFQRV